MITEISKEFNKALDISPCVSRNSCTRWAKNLSTVGNLKLVVLGPGEDYAEGLFPITFHSSRVTILVTAGSMGTQHNWIRVNG